MKPLSAQQIVTAWSRGESGSAQARSLALLGVACPELEPDALVELSIGERDARLLLVREKTFGPVLRGTTACGQCNARVSFDLDTRELRAEHPRPPAPGVHAFEVPGFSVRVRLPDSQDLAAAERCESVEQARDLLLRACVLEAVRAGQVVHPDDLPEDTVAAISTRLGELDPRADIPIELACSMCGNEWSVLLDIGAYLWTEVAAMAERLMYDVSRLGQIYGWSEDEILSLGAARRRYYLKMGQP